MNDALAFKNTIIDSAMASGTKSAKSANNMILEDDIFGTIVSANREGRCVFRNTEQFIRFMITSNIGKVGCVLVVIFFPRITRILISNLAGMGESCD